MSKRITLSNHFPLLIIDSGLGGLLTFEALDTALPTIPLLYHGDSAFAPYGEKTKEFLELRVLRILRFFANTFHIQGIVVACNTSASTIGSVLDEWCRKNNLHCWTILEGAKQLFQEFKKNDVPQVGVLATTRTVESGIYEKIGAEVHISTHSLACPKFVPLLESRSFTPSRILPIIDEYMTPFLSLHPDLKHIILGCTHYPLLQPLLEERYPSIHFFDPSKLLTKDIQLSLSSKQELPQKKAERHVFVSGDPSSFQRQMRAFDSQVQNMPQHIEVYT